MCLRRITLKILKYGGLNAQSLRCFIHLTRLHHFFEWRKSALHSAAERQPAKRSSRGTATVLRSRNSLATSPLAPSAPITTTGEEGLMGWFGIRTHLGPRNLSRSVRRQKRIPSFVVQKHLYESNLHTDRGRKSCSKQHGKN